MIAQRWAIVWKNLTTGAEGIGEGLFLHKEEALEFARLVGHPAAKEEGQHIVFDAEPVWVDLDKPLIGQVMEQWLRQQQEQKKRG